MNTNPAKQFLELNRPRERREPDADFSRLLKVNGPNDLGQEASAQVNLLLNIRTSRSTLRNSSLSSGMS
jgi:hypothetical protein